MALGRKKLPPEQLRRTKYLVAVNHAEDKAIRARAQHEGIRPAAYIRNAALQRRPKPARSDHETAVQLSRIGGNLNQLVRAIHQGYSIKPGTVEKTLVTINKAIQHLSD